MVAKGSLDSFSNFETTNRKESSRLEARKAYGRVSASFVKRKAIGKKKYTKFMKKKEGMHHLLLVESCLMVDFTNS